MSLAKASGEAHVPKIRDRYIQSSRTDPDRNSHLLVRHPRRLAWANYCTCITCSNIVHPVQVVVDAVDLIAFAKATLKKSVLDHDRRNVGHTAIFAKVNLKTLDAFLD